MNANRREPVALILVLAWFLHPAAAAAAAEPLRVACIGDSITYGLNLPARASNAYPARLQRLLGDGWAVRNFGSSGRGVIKSSRRGDGWRAFLRQPEHEAALAFQPQVVVCNLGINDLMEFPEKKAEFIPDYLELLRAYQDLPTHPRLFLWTRLAPLFPPHREFASPVPAEIEAALAEVARRAGAVGIDMRTPLEDAVELFPDGLHPDPGGAAIIARETAGYLTGDFGGLSLPWAFADHMVLQRELPAPIWGRADAGSCLMVEFGDRRAEVLAGPDGRWRADLGALTTSATARTLRVRMIGPKRTQERVVTDVLVGEVWLAAGQSNMAWPLKNCEGGPAAAGASSSLRLLNRSPAAPMDKRPWPPEIWPRCTPENFFTGEWQAAAPAAAADFSGVAWFFAQRLQEELRVPVGIIQLAVGGAPIEAFTSPAGLLRNPVQRPIVASRAVDWLDNPDVAEWPRQRGRENLAAWLTKPVPPRPHHPFEPSFIFRAGIRPLAPAGIRGVIWYQGESNATDASNRVPVAAVKARAGIEALIADWRACWGREVPFLQVQLPGLNRPWAEFREVQRQVAREVPGVGLAVTIDVGHPTDVHPRNKRPVGERLARCALGNVYGRDVERSGPEPLSARREGSSLVLAFGHAAGGLVLKDAGARTAFELAGADGRFVPARAEVRGTNLVLVADGIPSPAAARYAWAPDPPAVLYNRQNLPAGPFQMDGSHRDKQAEY